MRSLKVGRFNKHAQKNKSVEVGLVKRVALGSLEL